MGTASAYYLVKAGVRVTLLERLGLASGASGRNAGFVFYQTHGPGWTYQAAVVTRWLYEELARALPIDVEYRAGGGMIVGFEPEQFPLVRAYVERQGEMGHSMEFLGSDEARAREPALAEDVAAAAFSPDDAQVNPLRLTVGLAEAAATLGAQIRTGVEVTGLLRERSRVVGVETDEGPVRSRWVVNAAGPHSPRIGAFAGIRLPVSPRRVQIAVSHPMPPTVTGDVICGRRIVKSAAIFRDCQRRAFPDREPEGPGGHDTHAGMGHMLLVRQTASGNVILGESMDERIFQDGVNVDGLRTSLAHIKRVMPALGDLEVLRVWNGTLGDGPDGLPLIGEWSEAPGLVIAAGHGGVGILQGPVTGLLVSQIVTGAPPAVPIEPVRPDRHNGAPQESRL